MKQTVSLPDLSATRRLAAQIAPLLRVGDFIALHGELGAGKTEFARSLLNVLGVAGDVPSPTFTIVQTYDTPKFAVSHLDLYRLKDSAELDELGWDDMLAESVMLVEWPSRAASRIPDDRTDMYFKLRDDGIRECAVIPCGMMVAR
jgi:tRNA threonylcarbamoyl adenosine modification protein YjeE